MSAFLQSLSVRFAGRPSGRPSRNGHPFHRGQLMPKENLGGFGGQSPPRLREIVWASAAQRLSGAPLPVSEQNLNVRFSPKLQCPVRRTVCGSDPTVAAARSLRAGRSRAARRGLPVEDGRSSRFLTACATVPVSRAPTWPRFLSPPVEPGVRHSPYVALVQDHASTLASPKGSASCTRRLSIELAAVR